MTKNGNKLSTLQLILLATGGIIISILYCKLLSNSALTKLEIANNIQKVQLEVNSHE